MQFKRDNCTNKLCAILAPGNAACIVIQDSPPCMLLLLTLAYHHSVSPCLYTDTTEKLPV